MKIDHKSRGGLLLIRLGAWIARGLLQLFGATCRVEVLAGREHLDDLLAHPRPVLLSFWHNRLWLGGHFLFNQLVRRGLGILVFASKSRDGELATQMARQWGLSVVRGSASRGGREAVRHIYRAVKSRGSSPIMIPDGPRGPLYHFKVGVAILSQMTEAPILPIGLAASRSWTLRSWDRMVVPKPFSRVVIVVGEPQAVPRDLDTAAIEAERLRLQDLLVELTVRAEEALGVDDVARPRRVAEASS